MADMECWLLEVTVISACDLEKVRDYFPMHPYVVASILNDKGHMEGQRSTPAHRKGDTSPCWNHTLAPPFTVDVAAALDGRLTLKLEIKTERTIKNHKDVGWVDVPVRELLEQGGDWRPRRKSFPVRLHSEGTKGSLELSYKFSDASTVPGVPPHQLPQDQQPPRPDRVWDWVRGATSGATIWGAMSNANGDGPVG